MNLQETIRRILREETNYVVCKCGWSWKLSEGGDDPYVCHKCGRDNSKDKGLNKLPESPQALIKSLPRELKELLFKQWGAKQNPVWHPEGNSLKHIIVVVSRAYHHYPDDPNMIMAALFHDVGKMDVYDINPKTNQPTAYGHEYKSTDYVDKFKEWILSFDGTDIDEIKYIVKNHMKVKPRTWDTMRDVKKDPIKSNKLFNKLMGFTDKLDGGGYDI